MRVKWSKNAYFDLFEADLYLKQQNPAKAKEMALAVRSAESLLCEYPGVAREGRIFGTREYILKKFPYLIVFRVLPEELEILAFFHTSRQPLEQDDLH